MGDEASHHSFIIKECETCGQRIIVPDPHESDEKSLAAGICTNVTASDATSPTNTGATNIMMKEKIEKIRK